MSDSNDQYRFGEDGELKEPDDNNGDEVQTNNFGEEMPWYETKDGFRRDVMLSLFQKAVRRSDDGTAAFATWEPVRSGPKYETNYWNRAVLACIKDLVAGNEATEHVLRYEDLAKNRYAEDDWARRLCAIAAASGEVHKTRPPCGHSACQARLMDSPGLSERGASTASADGFHRTADEAASSVGAKHLRAAMRLRRPESTGNTRSVEIPTMNAAPPHEAMNRYLKDRSTDVTDSTLSNYQTTLNIFCDGRTEKRGVENHGKAIKNEQMERREEYLKDI